MNDCINNWLDTGWTPLPEYNECYLSRKNNVQN